ncbi:MAG: hypothetical protein LBK77_07765 [Spirochaetaceae bacterium]|jgi:tetratricopeptide (TPR) repeat protein|nr:hypothetical protein [Spirochaetaceae bacterium]
MIQRIRVKLFIVLALLFRGPFIPGQEEQPVFAPFVSMLEAEIKNNLIRLSWKDAEDIRGPVYVYRSETSFSGRAAVSLPIPAEVPYGTGSYLDEADKSGVLYYFVVASDEWGRKYTLSIPYANMISVSIAPENVPGYYQPAPRAEGPVPPGANPAVPGGSSVPAGAPAGIGTISASVEGERIIINFSGADRSKNLLLYRSISPIRKPEDLLSALIIQRKRDAPFIDYPVPGIPYYYAVISEEDLGSALLVIRPGHNATAAAAAIPQKAGRPDSRDIPLPRVNLSGGAAVPDTPGPAAPVRRTGGGMEPSVFSEDLSGNPLEGEEYQLHTIVRGYFSIRDWDKSEEELGQFLALPRKTPVRARAHFYLGQVYYFQGKSREALFAFLTAQESYPSETAPWIRAVLGGFAE